MRKQMNMFHMKEQDKTPEKDLNEIEISNLPDKEFKIIVKKIISEFRRRMNAHSKNSTRREKI